jgi:hypothetical protein
MDILGALMCCSRVKRRRGQIDWSLVLSTEPYAGLLLELLGMRGSCAIRLCSVELLSCHKNHPWVLHFPGGGYGCHLLSLLRNRHPFVSGVSLKMMYAMECNDLIGLRSLELDFSKSNTDPLISAYHFKKFGETLRHLTCTWISSPGAACIFVPENLRHLGLLESISLSTIALYELHISDAHLAALPLLRKLHLRHVECSGISSAGLSSRLSFLRIEGCPGMIFSNATLALLPNLVELGMQDTDQAAVTDSAFSAMPQLRTLSFGCGGYGCSADHRRGPRVSDACFAGLAQLSSLTVGGCVHVGCGLCITDAAFAPFVALESLTLAHYDYAGVTLEFLRRLAPPHGFLTFLEILFCKYLTSKTYGLQSLLHRVRSTKIWDPRTS